MNDITRPVPRTPNSGTPPPVKPEPPKQEAAAAQPPALLTPPDEPKAIDRQQKPLQLTGVKKKRIWLRWLIGVAAFLFLAAIAAAAAGYMWYQNALTPVTNTMHNITFKVGEGASVEQIANHLESEGLVRSALATQIYMRLAHKTEVKAGNYVLSPNQSVAEIADWLNEGHIDTLKVTILPGRTLNDLKGDLAQYGYKPEDIEAALNEKWEHPILADKPAGVNIEGYVYPETYFMEADSTPHDLIKRSFDEFEKQIESQDIRKKLADKGFNLHQGVTLASIISSEVSGAEDQRKVSQVFQTRMAGDMTLGSDVTYIYGAELLGVQPSPDLDSPYNTRRVEGLPPGAISNFNLSVLDAVINPANTTYLFFVAGDDGVTHYSYTFSEHQDNVNKYCHRACMSN